MSTCCPESLSELQMNAQFQENLSGKNVDSEEAAMRQSKRELKIACYLHEKITTSTPCCW